MGRQRFEYKPKIGGNRIQPELIAYPCLFPFYGVYTKTCPSLPVELNTFNLSGICEFPQRKSGELVKKGKFGGVSLRNSAICLVPFFLSLVRYLAQLKLVKQLSDLFIRFIRSESNFPSVLI